jgi:hypothetical protein
MMQELWVFNGENARFPSGIFSEREIAEGWIRENKLSGVLTLYPLDKGVYSWAIEKGYFMPQKENEKTSEFIQKFTSAEQEHYHYTGGSID